MTTARIVSRAPGKLVVLGEYAVLSGAPAMVLAVDRYCHAEIGPSEDGYCHLLSRTGEDHSASFFPEMGSGFGLVDEVIKSLPGVSPWCGTLDSRELFAGDTKLGLGSSSAALTSWAGAWSVFSGQNNLEANSETLKTLVGLHRAIQGDVGSGVDVAASLFGGVIRYQLLELSEPSASVARLPNSVGFVGVFTRSAAATPDYLARYDAWREAAPVEAVTQIDVLTEIAQNGIDAATGDDVDGFLAAIIDYGRCLERLGERIGVDIVSSKHRKVMRQAEQLNIAYKVSGAGGGDLGLAFSTDSVALEKFKKSVEPDCEVIEFSIDPSGLVVEAVEK